MTKELYRLHAELCKVLSSPARLEILNMLRDGRKSVGELTKITGYGQANISQHLTVMKRNGVVNFEREGNNVYYSLADAKIIRAFDIIREMLGERLKKELKEVTIGRR
ncbi:MAG: metalloregulator ArsR/SmtB family transcription factor [Thaumarchaeota archaeon]|nr:metalloregulator ArsR/SmtB family transcription factor [Nitrososphaerota archaeon]